VATMVGSRAASWGVDRWEADTVEVVEVVEVMVQVAVVAANQAALEEGVGVAMVAATASASMVVVAVVHLVEGRPADTLAAVAIEVVAVVVCKAVGMKVAMVAMVARVELAGP